MLNFFSEDPLPGKIGDLVQIPSFCSSVTKLGCCSLGERAALACAGARTGEAKNWGGFWGIAKSFVEISKLYLTGIIYRAQLRRCYGSNLVGHGSAVVALICAALAHAGGLIHKNGDSMAHVSV